MKKTLIVFIMLLIGLFFLLSLLGRQSNYIAEKIIWNINQDFSRIAKDPKRTPDAAFDQIFLRYNKFIRKFPDSNLVSAAYLSSGKVYIFKKDYIKAREKFEEIIKKYSKNPVIVVKAMELILKSYGEEKDDNNILKTYERIIKEYPVTSLGLRTPLLIAQFYRQRNLEGKAEVALDKAIVHYKILIKKYPDSIIEYRVLREMSTCYLSQKKWSEAVNTLGNILIKFSDIQILTPKKADVLTKSINTISVFKLKNTRLPIKIYQNFMSEHPKHPFNKTLTELIQKLNALQKEKKGILL